MVGIDQRFSFVRECMHRSEKITKALVVPLCAIAAVSLTSGCRASDALKEIIYEQTSETVDYNNPNKYYINDSTADEKSDQVSAKETDDDSSSTDTEQNLVVYSSDPNTKDYTAKQSIFSDKPDFEGIEASEKVFFYKSKDKDAIDHTVTKKENKDKKKKEEDNDEADKSGGGKAVDQLDDNGSGGKGDKATPANKKDSSGDGDEAAGKKARKVDPTRVDYNGDDPTEEVPQVEKVAAYGSYAVMVQMIAGEGALVATDAKTLSSKFSKVFNTKKIAKVWSDGGSAKCLDVDKLIKSGATRIITSDSAYLEKLSNKDFGKLAKAGIKIIKLRPLTTSKYIKDCVTKIGKMFDGTSAGSYAKAGKTVARAKAYSEFHDRVIKECIDANGGSYAGTDVYQANGKVDVDANGTNAGKSTYTLLVDAYDKNATYKGTSLGKNWKPAKGLAYSSSGCTSTPVSYYIQCGGLVNNAAAATTKSSSGEIPLWQFNYALFEFNPKNWSGITVNLLDSKAIKNTSSVLLDSGQNVAGQTGLGAGFGSSKFPKLITTTSSIKANIISNSKKKNGMYTPYSWVEAGDGRNISSFGVNMGSMVLPSCIGSEGTNDSDNTTNPLGNSIPSDSIEVNPQGLFSDWTEGTVESFLEAAWVSDEVNDNANGVDWEKEAKDFYKEFYDYDLNTNDLTK